MVGDQLFTDVKGAKKLGIMALLVDPLGGDHWLTRHRRRRQDRVMRDHCYTD
jgi:predicted HAD superfamily phosphohydrolase YqeG